VPNLPRDEGGPVFREPWEARVFAITLALYQRGVFTWPEWTAALSDAIKRAPPGGDPSRDDTYYRHSRRRTRHYRVERPWWGAGQLERSVVANSLHRHWPIWRR
jgi:nitrile hydratase accessory protein